MGQSTSQILLFFLGYHYSPLTFLKHLSGCYETHRPIQKRWECAKKFFFEKPNKTMSFFRSAFQSTLSKHAGEVFFLLRNADFFKFKIASELS